MSDWLRPLSLAVALYAASLVIIGLATGNWKKAARIAAMTTAAGGAVSGTHRKVCNHCARGKKERAE